MMRLPRVRFTVRRLMVAVAVAAALLFSALRIVPAAWLSWAHAASEREYARRSFALTFEKCEQDITASDQWYARSAEYHARQKRVYLRSLLRFWEPLPVESMPPPPPAPSPPPSAPAPLRPVAPDTPEPE
jgi:hypothetical protein